MTLTSLIDTIIATTRTTGRKPTRLELSAVEIAGVQRCIAEHDKRYGLEASAVVKRGDGYVMTVIGVDIYQGEQT